MQLAPVIILHSPVADSEKLGNFVEQCLLDQVELIAIFGPECDELEESVDWIVVGDGTDPDRFVVTSSHPGESFEEVMEFAMSWTCSREGGVQIIRL